MIDNSINSCICDGVVMDPDDCRAEPGMLEELERQLEVDAEPLQSERVGNSYIALAHAAVKRVVDDACSRANMLRFSIGKFCVGRQQDSHSRRAPSEHSEADRREQVVWTHVDAPCLRKVRWQGQHLLQGCGRKSPDIFTDYLRSNVESLSPHGISAVCRVAAYMRRGRCVY